MKLRSRLIQLTGLKLDAAFEFVVGERAEDALAVGADEQDFNFIAVAKFDGGGQEGVANIAIREAQRIAARVLSLDATFHQVAWLVILNW